MNTFFEKRLTALIAITVPVKLCISKMFFILLDPGTIRDIGKKLVQFDSRLEEILTIGLFAPLFETLIIQYAFFKLLQPAIHPFFIIILSAVVFGLMHSYGAWYMLHGFISGLILGYVFFIASKRKLGFSVTAIVHSIYNISVFMLNHM